MNSPLSVAIETSCRRGGVALGRGEELLEAVTFDASARHATLLIVRLRELLARVGLRPQELEEAYVSAGPGSFTGLRVGVTAARTLGQFLPRLRLVSVPTALAVALRLEAVAWQHLAVVMDARDGEVYAAPFTRRNGRACLSEAPKVLPSRELPARAPRPLLGAGEAIAHDELLRGLRGGRRADENADRFRDVTLAGEEYDLPAVEGVWQAGRRLARAGSFVHYNELLPIYSRKPQALRVWEAREQTGRK